MCISLAYRSTKWLLAMVYDGTPFVGPQVSTADNKDAEYGE